MGTVFNEFCDNFTDAIRGYEYCSMTLSVHFGILTLTWTEAIENLPIEEKETIQVKIDPSVPFVDNFSICSSPVIIFSVLFSLSARLFIVNISQVKYKKIEIIYYIYLYFILFNIFIYRKFRLHTFNIGSFIMTF